MQKFRRLCLVLWVCMLLCVCTGSLGGPLKEPLVIEPKRSGKTRATLRVAMHRLRIPLESESGEDLFFEYTGRVFEAKRGVPLLPGPTLRARPGGKIMLTVVNALEAENAKLPSPSPHAGMANSTNVHFHGLHCDPKKDTPFLVIPPGEKHVYKIGLQRDHEPGLHWYHNHVHGTSTQQLMGGLFGAIVVEEGTFITSRVHPFRDVEKHVLLMHMYRLRNTSSRCDGPSMETLDTEVGSLPSNPRIVDRRGRAQELPDDLLLVNGQHRPTVTVVAGVPSLLQMAYAAGQCYVNMSLPAACAFHIVAVDGIQTRRTREARGGWLYFTTATRIGAAVVCGEEGTFPVTRADDPADVLFYIEAVQGKSLPSVPQQFPVTMPRYNPDYLALGGATRHYTREISFSQRDRTPGGSYVIGQGTDCSSLRNSSTCIYKSFSGEHGKNATEYDGFAVPLHSVITARIYGDPEDDVPHPLHFHVNHFKVLSFEPRPGGRHANHTLAMYGVRANKYRDTIPILDGVTTIQWQAATYTGEIVYHCHTLHHQDKGMMLSYYVYSDMKGTFYSPDPLTTHTSRWAIWVDTVIAVAALAAAAAFAYVWLKSKAAGSAQEAEPLLPR